MVRTGLGISTHCDSIEAGRRSAERALSQLHEPAAAILFVSARHDHQRAVDAVRTLLPSIPLIASSSCLELTNAGLTEGAVVVLLIAGDSLSFFAAAEAVDQDDPAKSARRLAERLSGEVFHFGHEGATTACPADKQWMAVFIADENHFRGQECVKTLCDELPIALPIVGGGSSGVWSHEFDPSFFQGLQSCNELTSRGLLTAMTVCNEDPESVAFGFSFQSRWSPIAPPVQVTRAAGSRVFDVDGRPIDEYLRTFLGNDYRQRLTSTLYKFSFITRLEGHRSDENSRDDSAYVVRTPGDLAADGSAIDFFPQEDMDGVELQLIQLSRDELVQSARQAAERARAALGDFHPTLALAFSCHLRNRVLHSRTTDEIQAVLDVLGEDVPLAGFYCCGEYGPVRERYEEIISEDEPLKGSRQLSTSLSLVVFGSKTKPDRAGLKQQLLQWLDEDRCDEGEAGTARQISRLEGQLTRAEKVLDETELALKFVNQEHYELALRLQEANRQNEHLQEIIRSLTPQTVWRKARSSVAAGRYHIPDEELACTLMFLDIKGFTAYAEQHRPAEVIGAINDIFEPFTAVIYEHGGDVDKFIGDCIFAVFPTPEPAVSAALKMHELFKTLDTPFAVRVGINEGRVVSGNVGSKLRRDNTLIGDAVNLAQRLESVCTPGSVLIAQELFEKVVGTIPLSVHVERRQVTVKGKSAPVAAVELRPA